MRTWRPRREEERRSGGNGCRVASEDVLEDELCEPKNLETGDEQIRLMKYEYRRGGMKKWTMYDS